MNIPERIEVHVHHHIHISLLSEIIAMSARFEEKLSRLAEAIERLEARVAEDFEELRRQVEEGTATEEQVERFNALVERLHAVDPDPDFPPAPEEPGDDEGGESGEPGEPGEPEDPENPTVGI